MRSIEIEETTVMIMVRDLDRAKSFYEEDLGFSVLYRAGPHFCMVEGPGLKLGLHPRGDHPPLGEASGGISIGFKVADLAAAVEVLKTAGVTFPNGIADDDGSLLRADFHDPDGTPLYLFQMRS